MNNKKFKRKMFKFWFLLILFASLTIINLIDNFSNSEVEQNNLIGKEVSNQSNLDTNSDKYLGEVSVNKNDITEEVQDEELLNKVEDAEQESLVNESDEEEVETSFYENVSTVSNANSELVLVNKNHALDSSYVPNDLVLLNVLGLGRKQNTTIYLRKEAATQLEKLFSAAKQEKSLVLLARSGYRSYQTQEELYRRYSKQYGQEKADYFSARAGHSEHQTGLAIDVTADSVNGELITAFGETDEGIWLKENAHRFGYIIRYLKGRESETGYQYEPWHIRYVGEEVATEIYENNLILEEYLNR